MVYIAVFAVFAVVVVLYLNTTTNTLLTRQLNDTINAEIRGLAEQYNQRGLPGLVSLVDRRSRQPGANLYLVINNSGSVVVGNIARLPVSVLQNIDSEPRELVYRLREDGGTAREHVAVVRVFELPRGFKILVGRDVGEREALQAVVRQTFLIGGGLLLVLGLFTWLFVSRRVLKRIDALSNTTRSIMSGDLSRRLQVTGSGDEFDRLALSLNTMLERIEELMHGLKEVSDNIAHDLKTPLTRLRNRVESALSKSANQSSRAVLEETIEDADSLIKTFNALLLIARVEAKAQGEAMGPVDLAEIAQDMGELYEPVVEDAGAVLTVQATDRAMINGNRELISQTIANLIDNALKYGVLEHRQTAGEILLHVSEIDGQMCLSVSDNGPGIDDAARSLVTERFARLDTSRSQPGSGLGLSLVSAVTSLHNGRMVLAHANASETDDGETDDGETDLARGLKVSLYFPPLVQDAGEQIGKT